MFDVFADYHTHTRYSHGSGTVRDNVDAARRRGLSGVAITDHGPGNLPWVGIGRAERLLTLRDEVRRVEAEFGDIRVFAGVEANIISVDGRLDVPRPILKELDITLCGLHPTVIPASFSDYLHLFGLNSLSRIFTGLAPRARLVNTKALVEAVHRYDIDIITHPGLHLSIDTAELARACAKRGTALELNASHNKLTVDFARVAAREGCRFAIDSDAHRPERVGALGPALAVAEAAGLSPEQIINVWPTGHSSSAGSAAGQDYRQD